MEEKESKQTHDRKALGDFIVYIIDRARCFLLQFKSSMPVSKSGAAFRKNRGKVKYHKFLYFVPSPFE